MPDQEQHPITFVDDFGNLRALGNVPTPDNLLRGPWPEYGSVPETPMIPRSEWDRYLAPDLEDPFLPYVHDQDGVGQCNCEAITLGLESCRAIQGLPHVKLSPADLYGRINGGRDQGSSLEDGMREALTNGVGTAQTSGLIWSRQTRYATEDERKRYRGLEAWLCPTFAHIASAAISGFRVIVGIMWCQNYNPGPDGWLPLTPGRQVGGHAFLGFSLHKKGTAYGLGCQNSWRTSFGLGGRFVCPEGAFNRTIGGHWAIRSVVDEGGVIPAPTT